MKAFRAGLHQKDSSGVATPHVYRTGRGMRARSAPGDLTQRLAIIAVPGILSEQGTKAGWGCYLRGFGYRRDLFAAWSGLHLANLLTVFVLYSGRFARVGPTHRRVFGRSRFSFLAALCLRVRALCSTEWCQSCRTDPVELGRRLIDEGGPEVV